MEKENSIDLIRKITHNVDMRPRELFFLFPFKTDEKRKEGALWCKIFDIGFLGASEYFFMYS